MGGNMLVLVNTSFGYIIGERINKDNKDVLTIKEPRNLVVANDKETGQFHFAVGEIPWKPAVMNLPVNHVCFDVTEEVVKKLYRQAVSGLVLAGSGDIQKPH